MSRPIASAHSPLENGFAEVAQLISLARQNTLQAVNTQLIQLYWQVGAYISDKIESAQWGEGVVAQLATYLAKSQPGLRGFTRPNLFRMRQFYEAYRGNEIVSALLTQIPWTHNLIILSRANGPKSVSFICGWRFWKSGQVESWSGSSKPLCLNGR